MKKIKPFIQCIDYWPGEIPDEKLAVYKQLIDEGQIIKHCVLFNQYTKTTVVEYYSVAPHEWILEEMKRRLENV